MPDMWNMVWPADFNEDGRTDLIAGQRSATRWRTFGPVVVRLGNGDGTFGDPRPAGVSGHPVTVGDFNRDGFIDAVILQDSGGTLSILPGRGDGTFASARALDPAPGLQFALSADFDGDGRRDLALGQVATETSPGVQVRPGLGNFAFGPAVPLPAGASSPVFATMADLNGDGRRDLAVAQVGPNVSVYLNRGGLLFDQSEIFIASGELWGIAAGDLDADGDADLVVTESHYFEDWSTENSGVYVARGNGDGTFSSPVRYAPPVNGPRTVVVGHFNGDSLLDVATGNLSWIYVDQDGPTRHYWDSVSIYPGLGDGRLGQPAVFRLDTVNAGDGSPGCDHDLSCYVDTHHSLKISDVNGDRRMDIITSPGAILLNRASTTNRPPTANAGPDRLADDDGLAHLSVAIVEPDWDWLSVEWRNEDGRIISHVPSFWYDTDWESESDQIGERTLTVTVIDARGGVARDTVVVRPSMPEVRVDRPGEGETLTAGDPYTIRWTAFDDRGIAGFDVYVHIEGQHPGTRITECTGLAGDARSCVWRSPGPVADSASVTVAITDTDGNTTFGSSGFFSIRASAPGGLPAGWDSRDVGAVGAAGSASHADGVFTVRGSGADIWGTADEFHFVSQARSFGAEGSAFEVTARVTSVQNVNQWTKVGVMVRAGFGAGAAHASLFVTPTTVKGIAFQRRRTSGGTTVHTYGPAITAPVWLKLTVSGDSVRAFYRRGTGPWTFIGRDTASGLVGTLRVGLAVSSHVDGTLAEATFDNVSVRALPSFAGRDVGSVGVAGTNRSNTVVHTVEGSGADIWGTADAFRFVATQPMPSQARISARVRSIENTHAWAKAGVMIRDSTAAGSPHVMVIVSPGRGVAMQYRATAGGTSAGITVSGTAPEWVRLTRNGTQFIGETSNDGRTWREIGRVTISMEETNFAGLAVTSHSNATLATAVFDDLVIEQ